MFPRLRMCGAILPLPHMLSQHGAELSGQQKKRYSSPVTGLEWPGGFQEVKAPRFHDNGTGWW